MTMVLPPKSVPSTATPSHVMVRKPPFCGLDAVFFTPPMAASKAVSAKLAVPLVTPVLFPPTPVNSVCVTPDNGLPGVSGGSAALSALLLDAQSTALTRPAITNRTFPLFMCVPSYSQVNPRGGRSARHGRDDDESAHRCKVLPLSSVRRPLLFNFYFFTRAAAPPPPN